MKITRFLASGIGALALFFAIATPTFASTYQYPYYSNYSTYPNYTASYGYTGNTVTTPYLCGSYWSSQPCNYTNTQVQYVYPYTTGTQYIYPQYQYQYQTQPYYYQYQQYQNQGYWNGYSYSGYSNNNVCPAGYYYWGTNCWVYPSNNQLFYPAR